MNASGSAIRAHGLRKSYGGIAAVAGIDLEIAPGEVFALLTQLDGSTLTDALRRLSKDPGVDASFDMSGDPRPLPMATEVVLLRVCQEALANVRKHARARSVTVLLGYDSDAVRLQVSDDGAGFDPDRVSGGYGLRGMRTRVAEAGGALTVHSSPGTGASVSAVVPGVTAIRVVLADDHPVVREGLIGMLAAEPDIEVVGEAASGPEAVALAERLRPDVVLMDLRMPGGDGVEAIRCLAGTTVVVLTTYDSDADILRAVEAGAAGYLKDTPRAVLADRVRAAARGETVLAPAVAGRLLGRIRAEPPSRTEQLSARETEVLALVARGLTNAEIGRALFVSEATVKTHLLRASAKLSVSGRTAAVTKAIETGALPPPGQPG